MLEKFKKYLILNDYAKNSCSNYYYRIKEFLQEVSIGNISEETINKFFLERKEKLSPETLNSYRKALKVFLKFLNKDIKIPKYAKVIQKVPDSISLEYIEEKIIPVVECIFENPLKVKTILYFMFWTGLRQGELLYLKRKNIDLKERTAIVLIPKTKKELIVIFPEDTANLMKLYFSIETEEENAFNLKMSTIKNIFLTLKPHFKDIRLRPHLFRHTHATEFMESGAGMKFLQDSLGHKNIQSTLRYLNNNIKIRKKMYDEFAKKIKKKKEE